MADQRSKPRNLWEMWRVNQFKTQCRIPAIDCGSVELHDYKFMLISFVLFRDFSPGGLTCPGADKALLLSLKATPEGSVKIFFPGTTYLTCGCNTEYYNGLNSTFHLYTFKMPYGNKSPMSVKQIFILCAQSLSLSDSL